MLLNSNGQLLTTAHNTKLPKTTTHFLLNNPSEHQFYSKTSSMVVLSKPIFSPAKLPFSNGGPGPKLRETPTIHRPEYFRGPMGLSRWGFLKWLIPGLWHLSYKIARNNRFWWWSLPAIEKRMINNLNKWYLRKHIWPNNNSSLLTRPTVIARCFSPTHGFGSGILGWIIGFNSAFHWGPHRRLET